MNKVLDSRQLQTLIEVIETGSFQTAAENLCCVPSAVSNRMKNLTEQVGVILFEQDGRTVKPTAACHRLHKYAEMILELGARAVSDVKLNGSTYLPLRLGVIDTAASSYLPAWLRGLKTNDCSVQIIIETGHSIPLAEKVMSGALDAAFVAGNWEDTQLVQEHLIPEQLVLITSREHASPESLRWKTALAFSCPCTYRARLEQWANGKNIAVDHIIEFASAEAIIGSVAAGLGFSLLPKSIVRNSRFCDDLEETEVPPAIGEIPTVLVRNKDLPQHSAMPHLITCIEEWKKRGDESAVRFFDAQTRSGIN